MEAGSSGLYAKRWCSAEAVDRAAKACLRRKRGRLDAIAFRRRWGEEVLGLARRLSEGRYEPEPGIAFVTGRPKSREIHAATFRDRVVHYLLHQLLEPRLERSFIADSYACRPGRGTHAGVARLRTMMREVTREEGRAAFALKMDIRNYFNSIHKPTLLALLRRHFTAQERRHDGPWPVLVRVGTAGARGHGASPRCARAIRPRPDPQATGRARAGLRPAHREPHEPAARERLPRPARSACEAHARRPPLRAVCGRLRAALR